jgi:hypothetical protein
MKLVMFVQTNSGVAAKPGVSSKNVRLTAVPAPDANSNPNAAIFAGGVGMSVLDIQNLSPALAADLPEGQTFEVTITPVQTS